MSVAISVFVFLYCAAICAFVVKLLRDNILEFYAAKYLIIRVFTGIPIKLVIIFLYLK